VLVLAGVLAGCATRPSTPVAATDRTARLAALDQWSLQGRVAINLKRDGWTASLLWTQEAEQYTVRCMAPLGRGTWELRGRPGRVTLLTHENRLLLAENPESLLRQTVGWELPVSGMRWWVLGIADPAQPAGAITLDDEGRIERLEQSGWSIAYESYRVSGGIELPQKLTLNNAELKVRLVVSRWTVPP
jgi:outer membrane lipoprotein LolB